MSYFILIGSEDGVMMEGPLDAAWIHKWIKEATEEIKPEHHPQFQERLPSRSDGCFHNTRAVVIIKGEIIVPKPVDVVTEYEIE